MIIPASERAVAAEVGALLAAPLSPVRARRAAPLPPVRARRAAPLLLGYTRPAFGTFHRWYWALVPLLALLAYVTVLRIGFLSDDFVLLFEGGKQGLDAHTLLPQPPPFWSFYRPVGMLFTWVLGRHLWGFNPLPFHVTGLLIHAAASLVLGLWLAEATGRSTLGWLAGALFAVFPLHTEAVGWLAAQWDALAALFGILSLYCFTMWWRRRKGWYFNALALLCYALGLFTKESLLAWLPVLALSAWLMTPRFDRRAWRRLVYAMLPFCAVLALNVGLRLLTWGNLGGYRGISYDYIGHGWDWLNGHVRLLLSPINPAVLGDAAAQIVGVLASLALLLGLILYGRSRWRLLLLSAAWIVLALLPALNLPPNPQDMQQNRFLYLAAAGYCVGIAALLHSALASTLRWRWSAMVLTTLVILSGIAACWVQLRPWHTATTQVEELGQELHRLIPSRSGSNNAVWYVVNVPDNYKGAYLLRLGLGVLLYFTEGDTVQVKSAPTIAEAPLARDGRDGRDAFAMSFAYDESEARWHVDNAIGITAASQTLASSQAGDRVIAWDFRSCAPDLIARWQTVNAGSACKPGEGLALNPVGNDPYMIGPDLRVDPRTRGAAHLRLSASVRYPPDPQPQPWFSQWFWKTEATDWNAKDSTATPIKQDGETHIYWTILSSGGLKQPITRLRFDPVNDKVESTTQWIDVELVR